MFATLLIAAVVSAACDWARQPAGAGGVCRSVVAAWGHAAEHASGRHVVTGMPAVQACGGATGLACCDGSDPCCAVVGVRNAAVPGRNGVVVFAPSGAVQTVTVSDSEKRGQRIALKSPGSDDDQEGEGPQVWIGVRMAPIPKVLAAHVGDAGLMVSNVAKSSPADEAGLQQYDVIVTYDGEPVSAGDLPQKIAATGAGKKVTLGIIRGGKNLTVTIQPDQRPDGDADFKYEEPDALVDEAVKLRGGALFKGPGGQWQMQDLGMLKDLPTVLKGFQLFDEDGKTGLRHGFPFGVVVADGRMFSFDMGGADEDGNVRFEWRIEKSDENGSLAIHRKSDGSFTVERKDQDGNESSATYVDEDELRDGDRAAYDFYKSHQLHGAGHILRIRPDLKRLPALQKDWQEQIEKLLNESMQRSQKAYGDAMERAQRALEKAQTKQRARVEKKPARKGAAGADAHEGTVIVMQDGDGRLTITTTSPDGTTSKHSYASRGELKKKNPELYARVRDTLDSIGD